MTRGSTRLWLTLSVIGALLVAVIVPLAMWDANAADQEEVFQKSEDAETTSLSQSLEDLRSAERRLAEIEGYRCLFLKQERVAGVLRKPEKIRMKIKHEPFSAYLRYLSPESMNGQEAIYVEGQNDGNLLGHGAGLQAYFGTMALKPDSMLAMSGNRHPITSAGMKHLVEKLLVNYEENIDPTQVQVSVAEVVHDGHQCRVWELGYPEPQPDSDLAVARVYFDVDRRLPIKYELYTWADKSDDPPMLLESYEYQEIELNVGLAASDFDPNNSEYDFQPQK